MSVSLSASRSWFAPTAIACLHRLGPGVVLCLGVTVAAQVLALVERQLFGGVWIEALVFAIIVGTGVRTMWTPGEAWLPGISFSAKTLLEIAVMLLGASVSAAAVLRSGTALLLGIAGVVVLAIACAYGLGRMFGLSHRMAILVACGNAICGNSAIAAVAPVIGAEGEDIAASISFTALFGVIVVLVLPLAVPLLHLSSLQYGALAGLTVYAVPQVLAATAPVGQVAVQFGTLVKLLRVLMLGPVVFGLTMLNRSSGTPNMSVSRLVPWFILGFLGLAVLRSFGLIPVCVLPPVAQAANVLTIVSMAALGLGTDIASTCRAGIRVTAVVTVSLVMLGVLSVGLISIINV